jgi:hypothetical protein
MSGYRLDYLDSILDRVINCYLRLQISSGTHQVYLMGTGGSLSGTNMKHTTHSLPSAAEVQIAGSFSCIPPIRLHDAVRTHICW